MPRFAALYGTALLWGSFGALFVTPDANTVGASGAVFGLMGGLAVVLRRLRFPLGQVVGRLDPDGLETAQGAARNPARAAAGYLAGQSRMRKKRGGKLS